MQPSRDSDLEVFFRALMLVGVAELFDKTWFMGLLLALRYNWRTVFVGSFLALLLHTFLAAALGYAFAKFLSQRVLNYMTAALFLVFTILYAKDWYQADPESDIIEAGKEEAGGDCELLGDHAAPEDGVSNVSTTDTDAGQAELSTNLASEAGHSPHTASGGDGHRAATTIGELAVFGKSFMGVFIAEWGDRTQIAMIGQHASQPLVPVFLGSVVAFFLLTLSAVGAATLLNGQQLKEKTVFGFSACCFAVFAILSLHDALTTPS